MRKVCLLILACIVTLCCLIGCSKNDAVADETSAPTEDPTSKIWGTWEAELGQIHLLYVFDSDGNYKSYGSSGTNAKIKIDGSQGTYIANDSHIILSDDEKGKETVLGYEVTETRLIITSTADGVSRDTVFKRVD